MGTSSYCFSLRRGGTSKFSTESYLNLGPRPRGA
eukprot:SAG31_NODE_41829_length_274_cov_0.691429_1_plen_33_part_10